MSKLFIRSIPRQCKIFLGSRSSSKTSLKLEDQQLIESDISSVELLKPTNDSSRDTSLSALLELQQHKLALTHKQFADIPFEERQKLHKLWKRIAVLEKRLIRRIFD